jgi:nucleoside-diphosphate-sugar epimerase
MKIAIIGCGYTGRVLAARLIERGSAVRATTTTDTNLAALAALGAEPVVARVDRFEALKSTMRGADAVVYLAPANAEEPAKVIADRLAAACPSGIKSFVYGSSTGVYGKQSDPEGWVDESTPPRDPGERGRLNLEMEHALLGAGLPLKLVRIAGIYGPSRTLYDLLRRQELLVFSGGPPTSRIHVADLARILETMTRPEAPPLVLACDDLPATTLEIAEYTSALVGLPPPAPLSIADARRVMSPAALELRLGGHRCRSMVQKKLIGPLDFPTYREGVRASLLADGVALRDRSTLSR